MGDPRSHGVYPVRISIYLIKIQASYANYTDIFELKIVFSFIFQLDLDTNSLRAAIRGSGVRTGEVTRWQGKAIRAIGEATIRTTQCAGNRKD